MRWKISWIVCALLLSSCNMSVNPLTPSPEQPVEETELPPTPYPDTPAPQAIDAPTVESPAFTEIDFFNELDAWGVTETHVVRTNDGGITWYDVTPEDLEEIGYTVETYFLDKNHAWIQKPDFNNFPNNGLLYHTADGGLSWSISSTPFSAGDLSFVNASEGWMLADLGVGAGSNAVAVFQTTDGGATWSQTYTNDPNDPESGDSLPLGGIKADLVPINMQTAWVGGVVYSPGTPYFYRTGNGGRTWVPVPLELADGAEELELGINEDQIKFVSADVGFMALYMAGEAPRTAIYTTNNGGNTWTLTPTLIPESGQVEFLSAEEAVIYNGEQFYVTRDAARTWTTVSPDIVFGDSFLTMDFVTPSAGWVITIDPSNQRSLYRTHDGGATWLPVEP
ncbi:MAG TPA: hypothetical protein VK897_01775 [Anaerolineales bacterium]|nr:hypothetical protein [Anaerolineales bacterium]